VKKILSPLPSALITFATGIAILIFLSRLDFENSEIFLAMVFPLFYIAVAASLSRHRVSHRWIYIFCLSLAVYLVYFAVDSQLGLFSAPEIEGQHYRVAVVEEPVLWAQFLVLDTLTLLPLMIFTLLAFLLMYLIFRLFPKKSQ